MSVELMSKMARRLLSLVGRAKVTTSDDAGPIQTLQGKFNDLEVIDGMPRAAEFGFASRLPAGTDLVVVFLNGDRSNGVVLGTNHPASRPRNLAEGKLRSIACSVSVFTFLGLALRLRGRAAGDDQNASQITVQCETSVKLIAPGGVDMETAQLRVSGEIIDNAATNNKTMAQMRQIFDRHAHGGVQRGSSRTDTPGEHMG